MPKKKYGSITVKASENRKLYDKLRYQLAVKPYRKSKGRAGVMHLRCPLCSHFINYQKFLERPPNSNLDVKMFWYGGRANIQIQDFTRIEPQIKQNIKNTINHKLKSLLIAFKGDLEPFVEGVVISENYDLKPEIREEISIAIKEEVSL